MRIRTLCKRIYLTWKALKMGWRHGGAIQVQVSQLDHGKILRGKHILITGGSTGIGLAIAKKCVAEGATVVITGRDEKRLQKAEETINSTSLHTVVWNMRETKKIKDKLLSAIERLGGRLDIVVNNAGVVSTVQFDSVTEEIWDSVYETNSKGVFFLCKETSAFWIANRHPGKIINIASSGGFMGAPGPYRMTKWDVVGLTKGLGRTLLRHGIIVNGIAPGMTSTNMVKIDAGKNAYVDTYPPSFRVALPEEIAEVALFLMSDAANYIVGQTIICDGGYSIHM